jgi:hypothetical protein
MSAVHLTLRSAIKRNLSHMLGALFLLVVASALPAQIVETGIITGIVKGQHRCSGDQSQCNRAQHEHRLDDQHHH